MNWLPNPDFIQHLSLPLELLGLFLVMLEMYFPKHAMRAELAIDNARSALDTSTLMPFFLEFVKRSGGKLTKTAKSILYLFMSLIIHGSIFVALQYMLGWRYAWVYASVVIVTANFFILAAYNYITYLEGPYPERQNKEPVWRPSRFWVAFFAIPYIILHVNFVVLIVPAHWILHRFDRLGKGHAIGGIGLALGFLGFSMEVYQVVMIDKDWDARTVAEIWGIYALITIALIVVAFLVNRLVKRDVKNPQ